MKFLLLTLITHHPDPVSGEKKSPADRLRDVVDSAVLAEELGFDGFAVGERHEDPFISSSPPVVLSNIAARTSRIGLFTGVTTLSLLDPVRAFEDYSTLDNLSGGRLELIIGKGNGRAGRVVSRDHRRPVGPQSRRLRTVPRAVGQRARDVVRQVPPAAGRCQGTAPAAAKARIRIWHGSATSKSPSTWPPATVTRSSPPT